ncbi:MAG TPA: HEAT repeat domain-containing protein [Vicinamibacterales bacterium]|nr:HEAT repeat domain-containing protein [Vicinamibacterales bacterium]
MTPVVVAATLLAIANLVLIVLVATRRWRLARTHRRRDELLTQMRRRAVEFTEGDVPAAPPSLNGVEAEMFTALLVDFSRQLRGPSRERIVDYFDSSGLFDAQLRRLASRWSSRRAMAAFMLGDIGSPRAVPALVRCLGDRSRDVRAAACRSLGRLGAVDAIEAIVICGVDGRVPRDTANLALLDVGPAAIDRIVELTKHEESSIRASAVEMIGLIGAASEVDPILERLSDPAAAVRVATASALGRLGAREGRDALIAALGDRVPDVRTAAATALGQIGGRDAVNVLMPIARSDSFEPARAAAEALARIDPALVMRLGADPDSGPHLREAADREAL